MIPITQHNNREKINFLFKESKESTSKKSKTEKKISIAQIAEEQKAKKLDNSKISNPKGILNAGTSTKYSSPSSNRGYTGQQTNNSIFDPNRVQKLSNKPSNDEKTKEIKKQLSKVKAGWKESSKKELLSNLQDVIKEKEGSVSSVHGKSTASGKKNAMQSGISIFDDEKTFYRIPDKTEGEKSRDLARHKKESDRKDWVETKKDTSSNFMNNLIKGLNELEK